MAIRLCGKPRTAHTTGRSIVRSCRPQPAHCHPAFVSKEKGGEPAASLVSVSNQSVPPRRKKVLVYRRAFV